MDENDVEIIKPAKKGEFGFIWRVVRTIQDNKFILQRYSSEYQAWFNVQTRHTAIEPTQLYDQLKGVRNE
jgi:hypothetical protein